MLRTDDGATITIAASPNIAGHRPLLRLDRGRVGGAVRDVFDPLIGLQTALARCREGTLTGALRANAAAVPNVKNGATGVPRVRRVRSRASATEACASDSRRASRSPHHGHVAPRRGASVVDELNVASHPVVVDGDGAAWDAEQRHAAFRGVRVRRAPP